MTYLNPGGYVTTDARRQQDHRLLQPRTAPRRDHRSAGQRHPLLLRQQPGPDQGRRSRRLDLHLHLRRQWQPHQRDRPPRPDHNLHLQRQQRSDELHRRQGQYHQLRVQLGRMTCFRSPMPTAREQAYTLQPARRGDAVPQRRRPGYRLHLQRPGPGRQRNLRRRHVVSLHL